MRFLKAFGAFWYDFVIGDDWKIAAYTVLALAIVVMLVVIGTLSDAAIAIVGAILLCTFFVLGVRYDARRSSR